nr:hypothetical protein [Tanacetum cinerariifolium]
MRRIGKGFSRRITLLFLTMVVQSQVGEGSAMSTDPHNTSSILQASSSQPQKTYKPSKPKRKNTQTKTTQANEIDSLKKRVKKLERRNNSRTHKLKRLYKVGLTARVESLDNEESLGKDASKQERRIDDIDADEDITLDKVKGIKVEKHVKLRKKDKIRLDEEAALKLQGKFDKEQRLTREKAKKELEANIALIETWDDVQAKTNADYQLAERLQAQEQDELTDAEKATVFKRVNIFEPIRSELVKEKEKRAGEELEQERSKNQKVNDDKERAELKKLMEIIPNEEEVAIDAIPLAVKSPRIID